MTVSRETSIWRNRPEADILAQGAARLGLPLDPDQITGLLSFFNELRRWNAKVNLIGPAPAPEQIVLHLLDSLAPLPWLSDHPARVLDLGSGGGLPGLVLKILRPAWEVSLVESRERKAAFLRHMVRCLGLAGLTVLEERADPVRGSIPRKSFQLVTARALGPLDRILPLAVPYLAPGGLLVAYKGPGADDELSKAQPALSGLGLSLLSDHRFTLPFLEHERVILIFRNDIVSHQ